MSIDEPAIRRKYNVAIQEAYSKFSLAIQPFKEIFNSKTREVEFEYARACKPATDEYMLTIQRLNDQYLKEVGLSPASIAPSVSVD